MLLAASNFIRHMFGCVRLTVMYAVGNHLFGFSIEFNQPLFFLYIEISDGPSYKYLVAFSVRCNGSTHMSNA